MNAKKFKDPIYGYIEIDEDIVRDVIDTATFQRLRDIRQTSYAPLYPASLHNRFVHSLGVYHLGQIAFAALWKSAESHKENGTKILGELDPDDASKWNRRKAVFELACLLHDVGHSPFSHTGEEFYQTSKSDKKITVDVKTFEEKIEKASPEDKEKFQEELVEAQRYTYSKHLAELSGDSVFCTSAIEAAAPHEIMSCIVALEKFNNYFNNSEEKSFFARCITGIQYEQALHLKDEDYRKMTAEKYAQIRDKMLLNCIISLLHSSVIDVDRLDYIIRDASTMGYQSVSIDYERLLNGIVLVMEDEFNFTVGFHKNAISVIENAVYAHDNEKKWVQGHPAILYDSFLVQQSIIEIGERIKEDYRDAKSTLFSYDSLTETGSMFGNRHVRLLCDADLIHLMKNVYPTVYSNEYFQRNSRRLPVWKSEAEFNNFFQGDDRKLIGDAMEDMMRGEAKTQSSIEVSDITLGEIEKEIEASQNAGLRFSVEFNKRKKRLLSALLDTCSKHDVERDVVLLSASFFKSNFSKGKVQELPIWFPNGNSPCRLHEVSPTLSSQSPKEDKLYYLFYRPKEGRIKVDIKEFVSDLVKAFRACREPSSL